MKGWLPCSAGLAVFSSVATVAAAPTPPGTLVNALAPADDCDYCHTFTNDDIHLDDPPFAPVVGWKGSMMGNAARDPVFWAGVAVADADHSDEVSECIRCHVPRAFLDDRADMITSVDDLIGAEIDGVTCELCHRMTDEGAIGNAQYHVDDVLTGMTVARRGPWDYTDGVPVPSTHDTMHDPYTGTSELCGTCHDVTTSRERVDDDGTPMGISFNEQRTYSEWLGSVFAQAGDDFRSCQSCHMSEVPDTAGCRDYVGVEAHPAGNRRHEFFGANRFMLQILQDINVDTPPAIFDFALDRIDEFVATAATIEATGPDSVDLSEGLEGLEVTVTNETGHKLPTGYSEGRVMWIEVTASYDDNPIWRSGYRDDETGEFEADEQLRTYQGVAEQLASGTTLHLLLNDHWVEDTRIPPRGLQQNVETDPVGDRYTLQGDGTWPNWDTHTYAFEPRPDITDTTDEDVLDVQVRLLYLINTPAYMDFLASQSTAGQDVAMLFDTAGGAQPIEVASTNLQIPIVGFGGGADSSDSSGGEPPGTTSGDTTEPTTTTPATGPTTDPDPTGDTGTDQTSGGADGASGGNDGCGCRHDPTRSGAPFLALLVATGLIRRRRHAVTAVT